MRILRSAGRLLRFAARWFRLRRVSMSCGPVCGGIGAFSGSGIRRLIIPRNWVNGVGLLGCGVPRFRLSGELLDA